MANLIVTLMRDEDPLINDFVIHHLNLGFDKIVIFDDLSAKPVSDVIRELPEPMQAQVTVYRMQSDYHTWRTAPPETLFDADIFAHYPNGKQMYLLNYALKHVCAPVDWVAFTDVDEFLCIPNQGNIQTLRHEIQDRGFSAMALTMLVFGHGYHMVPPEDNNICAYAWRAKNYTYHGKYFAHAGTMNVVHSPHIPMLHNKALFCDGNFEACTLETCFNTARVPNFSMPHIKHYMVLDFFSCFKRRMRIPIDRNVPFTPYDGSWTNRVEMVRYTSDVLDVTLATDLIALRAKLGLDIRSHVQALSNALNAAPQAARLSSTLDFEVLRRGLNAPETASHAELIFQFMSLPDPNLSLLSFFKLPDAFDPEICRMLNPRVGWLKPEEITSYYLNYGRFDGMTFE